MGVQFPEAIDCPSWRTKRLPSTQVLQAGLFHPISVCILASKVAQYRKISETINSIMNFNFLSQDWKISDAFFMNLHQHAVRMRKLRRVSSILASLEPEIIILTDPDVVFHFFLAFGQNLYVSAGQRLTAHSQMTLKKGIRNDKQIQL